MQEITQLVERPPPRPPLWEARLEGRPFEKKGRPPFDYTSVGEVFEPREAQAEDGSPLEAQGPEHTPERRAAP